MWNAFPVKQCSIEDTLTKPVFILDRFGFVCQFDESWHKIGGGHFGSRFRFCCDAFSIPALLFFLPDASGRAPCCAHLP